MAEQRFVSCGICHFDFSHGAQVCQGCQGTVIYGPTKLEVSQSIKAYAALWGIGVALLIYGIPWLLDSNWDFKIPAGWGLAEWGLLPTVIAALWGANAGLQKAHLDHSREIRTFRRL